MVEQVDTQHLKCCGLTSVRVRFPLRLLKRPSNLFRGFFVFVNIYSYISGMKYPLQDITKEKLTELLTKTDIPQSWMLDKIIKVKNSDNSKQNKTDNQ